MLLCLVACCVQWSTSGKYLHILSTKTAKYTKYYEIGQHIVLYGIPLYNCSGALVYIIGIWGGKHCPIDLEILTNFLPPLRFKDRDRSE